jgi:hypothetical protein
MANPNLLATTTCKLIGAYGTITSTSGAVDFVAAPPSGVLRKVVNLTFTNNSASTDAQLLCYLKIDASARHIASDMIIPTNSSFVVITKDAPIYLNDLHGTTGTTNGMSLYGNAVVGALDYFVSYEEYS